ncbi:MAG: SDR family NAD(P)-dependent oxidoreductase [Promethearchaeota archaeon]|jgi:3-oxoacyl-[acyl-carrier protein] reductase
MKLVGKTALITGSCSEGMGRSIALCLAREGANIVLNYGTHRHGDDVQAQAETIAETIKELGSKAIIQPADPTNEQQVRSMVNAALEAFGSVDILVNNAGGGWEIKDYTVISLEQWKNVLSAEIDGAFLTMKYIVPKMRERKWGRIIHIGLSGALGMERMTYVAPDYCLGKAVRNWMTTAFGLQEFSKGITVNCIEPGPTAQITYENAIKAVKGDYSTWQQRKKCNPHDIAEIIAFLCSEAGRFISGSTIRLPTS